MLTVEQISKTYQNQPLLDKITFTVAKGETIALLGPSGSGKSTLLRIIAGLEQAEGGRVLWQGQDLADTPTHLRRFGLMFQDYALFPHRSVEENVAFGLRMQHLPPAEIAERVRHALEMVGLSNFGNRRVTNLSGGEQQRVALARALAPQPRLLMLDEPLAALDRTLREELVEALRKILHSTGLPAIYVTHDQGEASAVSDRLVLLLDGKIAQAGTPEAIYTHPQSAAVAKFFALGNLLPGERLPDGSIHTALGNFQPGCNRSETAAAARLTLLLRPTGALPAAAESPPWNRISGVVTDRVFREGMYHVELTCAGGAEMHFYLAHAPAVGQPLELVIAPESILCLPENPA